MPEFTGKSLVLGSVEKKNPFWVDKKNRNEVMIKELLRPDVNGMFLFYFYRNQGSMGEGFLMPPGLTNEQTRGFQAEFRTLFEKYAKMVNKKK